MKKSLLLLSFLLLSIGISGQKVIFLHQSVGNGVYTEGGVAQWFSTYNTNNGTNYQVSERTYPNTPYALNNYPYDYWNLWLNNQCDIAVPNIECLSKLALDNDVIILKHSYPGAAIGADGVSPSVSSSSKTLTNYKLQYRALRALMDTYPTKKFIVWTLAPLHRLATNTTEATRARQFSDWVKTGWLTEDANPHPNIFIFDFFGLAAESNPTPVNGLVNCLKYDYEISHTASGSNPNTLANQTIGPIFSQFIVNTIQNLPTDVNSLKSDKIIKIFPNPASDEVTIEFTGIAGKNISIEFIDLHGVIVHHEYVNDKRNVVINTSKLKKGTYIVKTETDSFTLQNKLMIFR